MILRPPAEPLHDGAIVVRLPEDRDVDALVACGDDPDVAETIWVPIPSPCSEAQAAGRLEEFRRGWDEESRFGPTLIIAEADTVEMIGIIFLRIRELGSVELSYGVASPHRNHGIATSALSLVSNWCLEELGAVRVELRIGQQNLASQRVAAKTGFKPEGIVRSHVAATGEDYDDLLFIRR